MKTLMTTLLAATVLAGPAFAQDVVQTAEAPTPQAPSANNHGIAAVVNSDIVTTHDLRQRVLFLLATTGASRDEASLNRLQNQALRNLIDEHIQMQESTKYEQTISDEQVNRSVADLISRNGLEAEEVAQRLASVGVTLGTLQDQVRSEIAWQRIVNGLYGSRIRISDAQIDETLNRLTANASKPAYRVAEIYIEATSDIGGQDGAMEGANAMIAQLREGAPFPLLAQQFSSAPTAAKGGDLGFVRLGELRPEVDAAIAKLDVGGISEPIVVPGGVYVVALLDKRVSEADTVYRLHQINKSATADEAPTVEGEFIGYKAQLSGCDTIAEDVADFEGVQNSSMGEVKASDMTPDILGLIETLDDGELSDPLVTPQGVVALMVCESETTGTNIPTRDEIEERLIDQQLAQASRRHLRDLRRQAAIVTR